MAYDRYERDDERRGERSSRGGERWRDRDHGRDRDERGFFERAGDEMRSWFGDEDRNHPREQGMRSDRNQRRDFDEGDRRSAFARSSGDDDRRSDRGRDRRERDEDRSYRPMGWAMSDRDYQSGYDREFEPRDYRPITGDYGRGASGRQDDRRDFDRGSEWDRDEYRRTSFAGSSARSQRDDPHYEEWRRRQMGELDRDYDDYRREHQ